MKLSRKTLIIAMLLSFAIGGVLGGQQYSPTNPDRPVLRLLGRVARLGLWFMAFAEPAPTAQHAKVSVLADGVDHYRSL